MVPRSVGADDELRQFDPPGEGTGRKQHGLAPPASRPRISEGHGQPVARDTLPQAGGRERDVGAPSAPALNLQVSFCDLNRHIRVSAAAGQTEAGVGAAVNQASLGREGWCRTASGDAGASQNEAMKDGEPKSHSHGLSRSSTAVIGHLT